MRHLMLLLALVLAGCGARAQDMTSVLTQTLKVYADKGADAYIEAVLKDGPLEGNKDAMVQANMLRTIEGYYGSYLSFEVVRETKAGARTRLVYYVLNYEHGPVFARATGYKAGETWGIVSFKFNSDAQQVWPEWLLASE